MSKDGGPAFPQDLQGRRGDDPSLQGMTLRQWYAGQALAGLRSATTAAQSVVLAKLAFADADAMIAAEKGND